MRILVPAVLPGRMSIAVAAAVCCTGASSGRPVV
jgi:hypothetical protein